MLSKAISLVFALFFVSSALAQEAPYFRLSGGSDTSSPQTQQPLNVRLSAPIPGTINAGSSFAVGLIGSGGTPPYTFQMHGATPDSTSINGTNFSGTPMLVGDYLFTISVTDSKGRTADSAPISFSVVNPQPTERLVMGSYTGDITGTSGVPLSIAPPEVRGGVPPYRYFTCTGCGRQVWIAGLTIDPASGVISGTPNAPAGGVFPFLIGVSDSIGNHTWSGFININLNPSQGGDGSGGRLTIASYDAPVTWQVGIQSSISNPGVTGGFPPYSYSLWPNTSLPDGVTLDPTTGEIAGTPTTSGTGDFLVLVTDSTGNTATANAVSWSVVLP